MLLSRRHLTVDIGAVESPPVFTDAGLASLPGVAGVPNCEYGSIAWTDFDNDDRLGFVITGGTNVQAASAFAQLWRNTGSGFTNVTSAVAPGLPGVMNSALAWGDYDNDGRADLLLTGLGTNGLPLTQPWRNTTVLCARCRRPG